MYTWAGPEIAVATTKAYSCQLIALYLLSLKFSKVRGKITDSEMEQYIEDLKRIPDQVETAFEQTRTRYRNLPIVIWRQETSSLSEEG